MFALYLYQHINGAVTCDLPLQVVILLRRNQLAPDSAICTLNLHDLKVFF